MVQVLLAPNRLLRIYAAASLRHVIIIVLTLNFAINSAAQTNVLARLVHSSLQQSSIDSCFTRIWRFVRLYLVWCSLPADSTTIDDTGHAWVSPSFAFFSRQPCWMLIICSPERARQNCCFSSYRIPGYQVRSNTQGDNMTTRHTFTPLPLPRISEFRISKPSFSKRAGQPGGLSRRRIYNKMCTWYILSSTSNAVLLHTYRVDTWYRRFESPHGFCLLK